MNSRTWLAWGIACMVPLLVARHPVILLQMLGTVLLVRWLCSPATAMRWQWILRIALVFAAIGVVFNALTVRTGNQVAFRIDAFGWDITWNAIIYGLVASLAMVTLVLTGITMAAGLDWIELSRVLPRRLAPLAAAGSVAWSFLPGASHALADIREAQAARGHALRGVRDLLPIVAPLLDTSLSRALTMSEALEVRGFGGSATLSPAHRARIPMWSIILVLGALVATYAVSLGDGRFAAVATGIALLGLIGILRSPTTVPPTTRYREPKQQQADILVQVASGIALVLFLVLFMTNPNGVVFNPYPDIVLDPPDYRYVLVSSLLLAPALYPADRELQ